MAKPVLYLDILGTLMLDRGGELQLASYARTFVKAVRDRFELRFLTDLEEYQALGVAQALEAPISYVPYSRALGKAGALDFSEEFYWVDDDPTPADLLRLSDERCSERLIPVNRREGVTEATLKKLLATAAEVAGRRVAHA